MSKNARRPRKAASTVRMHYGMRVLARLNVIESALLRALLDDPTFCVEQLMQLKSRIAEFNKLQFGPNGGQTPKE